MVFIPRWIQASIHIHVTPGGRNSSHICKLSKTENQAKSRVKLAKVCDIHGTWTLNFLQLALPITTNIQCLFPTQNHFYFQDLRIFLSTIWARGLSKVRGSKLLRLNERQTYALATFLIRERLVSTRIPFLFAYNGFKSQQGKKTKAKRPLCLQSLVP